MNKAVILRKVVVGPLQVNCFVVGCPQTRKAAVIDPGEDAERILEAVKDERLDVCCIVNTHGHFDHIGANRALVEATGAPLMIHPADAPLYAVASEHAEAFGLTTTPSPAAQRLLEDGDSVDVGKLRLQVLHVPGHSPGGICLHCLDHLFVGDALFAGSVGRTDLPGGNHQQLIDGIRRKLFSLPDQTIVHTGHGPDTTIGRERRDNPFVGDNIP